VNAPPWARSLRLSYGHCLDKCVFRGEFYAFVTTNANQRAKVSTRAFLSRQFAQRENLYAEFINEAAGLMADSLEQEMVKPSALVPIYGLKNRIRLIASDEVVQAARSAIQEIVESYRRPENDRGRHSPGAYLDIQDPVKEFGEACRKELKRLYRAAARAYRSSEWIWAYRDKDDRPIWILGQRKGGNAFGRSGTGSSKPTCSPS
jgi:hypothetical protein